MEGIDQGQLEARISKLTCKVLGCLAPAARGRRSCTEVAWTWDCWGFCLEWEDIFYILICGGPCRTVCKGIERNAQTPVIQVARTQELQGLMDVKRGHKLLASLLHEYQLNLRNSEKRPKDDQLENPSLVKKTQKQGYVGQVTFWLKNTKAIKEVISDKSAELQRNWASLFERFRLSKLSCSGLQLQLLEHFCGGLSWRHPSWTIPKV